MSEIKSINHLIDMNQSIFVTKDYYSEIFDFCDNVSVADE